jgi:MFS family permease
MVAKFGSRRVAIISAIAYPSILPLLGLAGTPWELVGGLFLFGVSGNMLNISMNTQAIGTELLYKRSIMASYHGIWSLAGFSGAAIGNLLTGLELLPYRHFGIITIIVWLLVWLSYRWLLVHDEDQPDQRPIFARPDRSLINLGIIAFCSMICEGAMADWSGVYFQKVIQPAPALVAAGYTAFTATMASGRFIGDWLTTRLGTKKILQGSGILTASGLMIAILFPYFLTAILGFLLVGAGVSSVVPLVYSSAGRSKTLSPGVALAAVSTIGYLGFLLGPPSIGFIAQASSLKWSLGMVALLGSVIALMAGKLER